MVFRWQLAFDEDLQAAWIAGEVIDQSRSGNHRWAVAGESRGQALQRMGSRGENVYLPIGRYLVPTECGNQACPYKRRLAAPGGAYNGEETRLRPSLG